MRQTGDRERKRGRCEQRQLQASWTNGASAFPIAALSGINDFRGFHLFTTPFMGTSGHGRLTLNQRHSDRRCQTLARNAIADERLFRVISGQTIASQNRVLSAVTPIADKLGRGWNVR